MHTTLSLVFTVVIDCKISSCHGHIVWTTIYICRTCKLRDISKIVLISGRNDVGLTICMLDNVVSYESMSSDCNGPVKKIFSA